MTFNPDQLRDGKGQWTSGDVGLAPGTPGINAPRVDWQRLDYEEKVPATPRSILKAWSIHPGSARGPADRSAGEQYKNAASPRAYRALVPLSDMDGYRSQKTIDSKGFTRTGAYPPIKVEISPAGKAFPVDGTHRMLYWKQQGFTHAPAWVIDYRKGSTKSAPVPSQRRVKKL